MHVKRVECTRGKVGWVGARDESGVRVGWFGAREESGVHEREGWAWVGT